jgi:hypothetical protein
MASTHNLVLVKLYGPGSFSHKQVPPLPHQPRRIDHGNSESVRRLGPTTRHIHHAFSFPIWPHICNIEPTCNQRLDLPPLLPGSNTNTTSSSHPPQVICHCKPLAMSDLTSGHSDPSFLVAGTCHLMAPTDYTPALYSLCLDLPYGRGT